MPEPKYPEVVVNLTGVSGNAGTILHEVTKTMRLNDIPKTERDAFLVEAMDGDYDHLLRTVMKWVTVEIE